MPTELHSEELITLAEAARAIPGRRPGQRLSISTVWRWVTAGVKGGIRLESVAVGGQRFTSREALSRFIARCDAAIGNAQPERTPAMARREHAKAEAELDRAGI